jgi:hypothetical protein
MSPSRCPQCADGRAWAELTRRLVSNEIWRRAGGRSLPVRRPLAGDSPRPHAPRMFVVSEAEAAAIRSAFDRGGELSAAVELRRLFPGITDNVQAQKCARIIAGWKPLAVAPPRPTPRGEGV